jgi:hypothetical protein
MATTAAKKAAAKKAPAKKASTKASPARGKEQAASKPDVAKEGRPLFINGDDLFIAKAVPDQD